MSHNVSSFFGGRKLQPDYTRLLRAIYRQGDPGFVPLLELFADAEIIAAFLNEPVCSYSSLENDRRTLEIVLDQKIRFWYQLGYDAIWQGDLLDLPDLFLFAADDHSIYPRSSRAWVKESSGRIQDWKDFEEYPWPRPEQVDYSPIEYLSLHLPEGMAIIGHVYGALEPVMWLMGYEHFALALYDQPDLVRAMFTKIDNIYTPIAETLVQMDRVMSLWVGDDMGFKTGTLISPVHLRQYVFPYHQKLARIVHGAGKPYMLHSCGKLDGIMEDLIDQVGINSKHSFEDNIESVESFVEKYGHRISAIGGVDVDLLSRGTVEQVRKRTLQILEKCAPSQGYILGSGNSIANYIPIKNFLAMIDAGHRFNNRG